jgi:hypothetical protein
MPAGEFQALKTTQKVGADQILGRAAVASLRGRLGGTFQNQIRRLRKRMQIFGRADISVHERDAAVAKFRQV